MPVKIDGEDLQGIQAIRDQWDAVTAEELADINEYLGSSPADQYTLWVELRCARVEKRLQGN